MSSPPSFSDPSGLQAIRSALRAMIRISDAEIADFLKDAEVQKFRKKEVISLPGRVPQEIYFINSGLILVSVTDRNGTAHTIHFATENLFFADYSCFIQQIPTVYTLQALEATEVVKLPRSAVEWGYANLKEGEKLGRLVAEYYFIFQDLRIKNTYTFSPKERYDKMNQLYPGISNRVSQALIASFLGISPVHLSRLKKEDRANS